MKVLIVFNHPAPYKVDIFNELNKYVDLTVIFERTKAKDRPNDFYYEKNILFKVIYNHHGYFGNENTCSLETRNYIKNHHQEFDLIVMNGYSKISEMFAISYLSRHHIPFVLLINGGIISPKELKIKKWIKTHFIKRAAYYLSPSLKSNEYLIYYGAKKENIFNYPYSSLLDKNIEEKPLNKEQKEEGRNLYHLPQNKLFVCPSQFIKRKNNIELISLFKDIQEASLLLIGDGEEKEKYLSYIKENHINNVYLMPFLEKNKLFDLMKYADGVISLSSYDIYGHTLLEGMALGLIPISSKNVISAYEIIDNKKNGYILNDNTELKNVIQNIDDSIAVQCIETAKKYTIEKCAIVFYEVFKEIVQS